MITIGIFSDSNSTDSLSGLLQQQLKSIKDTSYHYFNTCLTAQSNVTIDAKRIVWDGVDLSQLKVAFIHGFNYQNPVIPDSSDNKDWALWNADSIIRQQKYSLLFSLFSELQRRGVILVNSIAVLIGNYMKVNMLDCIEGDGLKAVEYLCTNDNKSIKDFCQTDTDSVWRPATGRASWQLFTKKQCNELASLKKPPILLAPIVDGAVRRAYCLNGEVVLVLNQANPSDQSQLERLEMYQSCDYSMFQERLSALCNKLNILWAEILFVESEQKLIIYDIEPDPPIEFLPLYYRDYLCQVLANHLLGITEQKPVNKISPKPIIAQRPSLFTRRMLRILFDFERSKYHE
jgi:hypothetical protein